MADRARFWGRVGGIFHTDELPAYGITAEEVEEIRKVVKAEEQDAVVFVADNPENSRDSLRAVVERTREAIEGVPQETRVANPDGTTRYMRPRPGAARMYPETDIPPIQITEDHIRKINRGKPELPEQKLKRVVNEFKLNEKLAKQVLDSQYSELFETIIEESGVSPITIVVFLTETMKALKRDGIQVEMVSEGQIRELFRIVGSGELAKEAIPEVVSWLSKNEAKNVQEAINSLGMKMLSEEEIEKIIDRIIGANKDAIEKRGQEAFSMVMGMIMKEVRGKANASSIKEILSRKLKR